MRDDRRLLEQENKAMRERIASLKAMLKQAQNQLVETTDFYADTDAGRALRRAEHFEDCYLAEKEKNDALENRIRSMTQEIAAMRQLRAAGKAD